MNLWFRLIFLLIRNHLFGRCIESPLDTSRLNFRVLPSDIDINFHFTNGRYWSVFDLGRVDLLQRAGIVGIMLKEKWSPVLGAASIHFRKELLPFRSFRLETRLMGWEGTRWVIEHRVLVGPADKVAAYALVIAGTYDRKNKAFLPVSDVIKEMPHGNVESPPLSEAARKLIEADMSRRSQEVHADRDGI